MEKIEITRIHYLIIGRNIKYLGSDVKEVTPPSFNEPFWKIILSNGDKFWTTDKVLFHFI